MSITYYLLVALVTLLINPICHLTAAKKYHKNCQKQCGDVKIKYPFGIGSECSYDGNYTIFCNESTPKPKPFFTRLNVELLEFRSGNSEREHEVIVMIPAYNSCTSAAGKSQNETVWNSLDMTGTVFTFNKYNTFVTVGCRGMATMYNETGGMIAACSSNCDTITVGCNGYLCCRSRIEPYGEYLNRYSIRISTIPGSCRLAFVSTYDFADSINATNHSSIPRTLLVPISLRYSYPDEGPVALVYDYTIPSDVVIRIALYGGPVLLSCCCCFGSRWYCKTRKRRTEIRLRAKYFKGRVPKSSNDEVVEKTKLFTISELKKATNNFNENQVLGQGGQGTVYKGMLTNGKVIAAKRPKTFEEKESKQFINEVILLSQVNHKNVVKLLGCCLETKLPLLVYEYVPNGTLRHHINQLNECSLSWKLRVRIAAEVAGAIAYLHSYSSTPIYHRDIKSTNILLDDKFHAIVSDFGISKAIVADKTHMTTCVQGTFGYLDPEYFRSSRFSEKSDVYSFGVIVVELLTGQQPIRTTDLDGEQSLVLYFINSMNSGSLLEILDPIVLEETRTEEIMIIANLAKQCLKPRGIERPTMKEVTMKLESLLKESSSKFSSFEIENCEIESTLDMDRPHTCPIMHNRATDTEYYVDDELPLFGVNTM